MGARWLGTFRLSVGSVLGLVIGGAGLALGVLISVAMLADGEAEIAPTGLWVCGLPAAALALAAGGLATPRVGARAVMWGLSACAWLAIGAAMGIDMAADGEVGAGIFGGILFGGTPAFLTAMGVVWSLTRVPSQARELHAEAVRAAVIDPLTSARGAVDVRDLASSGGVDEGEARGLVIDAVRGKQLDGELIPGTSLYAPRAVLEEGQVLLSRRLKARGRVEVAELERELALPRDLVVELVHRVAAASSFTGYVDLEHGVVMSADAAELTARGACPSCAGPLSLVGRGLIRCRACGASVYL